METNGFENSLSSDLSQPEILSTEVIFQILKEVKLHRLFSVKNGSDLPRNLWFM